MGKIPHWYKGRKIYDDIDGSEHYELDGDMLKQRGLNVHRSNYDKITEKQRQEAIQRRMR